MSEPADTARLLTDFVPLIEQLAESLNRSAAAPPLTPPASPHLARSSTSPENTAAARAVDDLKSRLAAVLTHVENKTKEARQAKQELIRREAERKTTLEQHIAASIKNDKAAMSKLSESEKNLRDIIREKLDDVTGLELQVADLKKEEAQLRKKLLAAENKRMREQIALEEAVRVRDEAHEEELARVKRDAEAQVQAAQQELTGVQQQLKTARADVAARDAVVQERNQALEEKTAALEEKTAALEEKNAALGERQTKCEELEEEVLKLKANLARYGQPDHCDWQFRRTRGSSVTAFSATLRLFKIVLTHKGA